MEQRAPPPKNLQKVDGLRKSCKIKNGRGGRLFISVRMGLKLFSTVSWVICEAHKRIPSVNLGEEDIRGKGC